MMRKKLTKTWVFVCLGAVLNAPCCFTLSLADQQPMIALGATLSLIIVGALAGAALGSSLDAAYSTAKGVKGAGGVEEKWGLTGPNLPESSDPSAIQERIPSNDHAAIKERRPGDEDSPAIQENR